MRAKRNAPPRRKERDIAAVGQFVERFALVMTGSGLPRMPARVFVGLLTADENRLTAAELADALQVSRAAISGAVKYLVQIGLVVRAREPGRRVDHYCVGGDTWFESFARRDELLARWEESLEEGVVALGADSPAGARLDETRRFFAFMRGEFPRLIRKWRKLRAEPGAAARASGDSSD